MTTLMQASNQWASRPDDQRFTSLSALTEHCAAQRQRSRATVVANRRVEIRPAPTDAIRGLEMVGPHGHSANMTHWSFGQVASLAGAPAGYLRKLPAPIAADALNYGLKFGRPVEETGVLLTRQDAGVELRAATGPNYGRIWNADIAGMLLKRFGDGDGHWRVPGEFGKRVEVTKANTTLYASDRDMFVFLADEENRIEVPARRNGQAGSLARGFFVWNSEVGAATLGVGFFLFDYVCCNRIVWGAEQYTEKRLRHTAGAPDRWLEQVAPVLEDYSRASAAPVTAALTAARTDRLGDADAVNEFLAKRFSAKVAQAVSLAHLADEGRPIETRWDAITGITAYARSLQHQDSRVELEREAGKLLAA